MTNLESDIRESIAIANDLERLLRDGPELERTVMARLAMLGHSIPDCRVVLGQMLRARRYELRGAVLYTLGVRHA